MTKRGHGKRTTPRSSPEKVLPRTQRTVDEDLVSYQTGNVSYDALFSRLLKGDSAEVLIAGRIAVERAYREAEVEAKKSRLEDARSAFAKARAMITAGSGGSPVTPLAIAQSQLYLPVHSMVILENRLPDTAEATAIYRSTVHLGTYAIRSLDGFTGDNQREIGQLNRVVTKFGGMAALQRKAPQSEGSWIIVPAHFNQDSGNKRGSTLMRRWDLSVLQLDQETGQIQTGARMLVRPVAPLHENPLAARAASAIGVFGLYINQDLRLPEDTVWSSKLLIHEMVAEILLPDDVEFTERLDRRNVLMDGALERQQQLLA